MLGFIRSQIMPDRGVSSRFKNLLPVFYVLKTKWPLEIRVLNVVLSSESGGASGDSTAELTSKASMAGSH